VVRSHRPCPAELGSARSAATTRRALHWPTHTSVLRLWSGPLIALADPLAHPPFLWLEEPGAEFAESFGAVVENGEKIGACGDRESQCFDLKFVGGFENVRGVAEAASRSLETSVNTSLSSTETPARNMLRGYSRS
jgi:hypothetical protein